MMRSRALLTLLGLVGLVACGGESPEEPEATEAVAAPIVGGEFADDDYPFVTVVVSAAGGCSAFAIAPNLVVTARHCVANYTEAYYECDTETSFQPVPTIGETPKEKVWVQFLAPPLGPYIAPPADESNAVALVKKIFAPDSLNLCYYDLAVLLLDRDLPAYVKPPPIRLDRTVPLKAGDSIVSAGWGAVDSRPHYPNGLQKAEGTIVGVGPLLFKVDPWPGVPIPDASIVTDTQPCTGDSGSPLISQSGVVLGVLATALNLDPSTYQIKDTREITGFCDENVHAVYGDLGYTPELIETAFAESGYVPWREGRPPPSALGGPCEIDDDCHTRLCVSQVGMEAGTCSQTCDGAPCPGGYDCVPRAGAAPVCLAPRASAGDDLSDDPDVGCAIGGATDSGRSNPALPLLALALATVARGRARRARGGTP